MPTPADAKIVVPDPDKQTIISSISGAVKFDHKTRPIDHYVLYDSEGKVMGVSVITSRVSPEIIGYQNEIALLVGVTKDGRISNVTLLAHEESPAHINLIISKGFLKAFEGKKVGSDLNKIEAITGATISSGAMKSDIESSAKEVLDKVIESGVLSEKKESDKIAALFGSKWIIITTASILVLIAMSIIAVYLPRKRYLRTLTLALSFAVIGFLFNFPITIGNFVDLGMGVIPTIANIALFILLIFAILSALFKGPVYCSYLCPFGAMQEGAAALKIPKLKIEDNKLKGFKILRPLILLLAIVAIAVLNWTAFRNIEPFSSCFGPAFNRAVWVQTGIILVAGLFYKRPWCRFFCPTGYLLELISRLSVKIRCKVLPRCKTKPGAA